MRSRNLQALEDTHPLGPFADRHGSWEITLHKRNDFDRFAIFSLTPSLPSPEMASGRYDVEVWIGADRAKHYTRRLGWSYALDEQELLQTDQKQTLAVLEDGVKLSLTAADAITPADLTEFLSSETQQPDALQVA